MTRSLFLTGTDTGVGKTFMGCLLAELVRGAGKSVGVLKPFSAGDLNDAVRLQRAAGEKGAPQDATLLYCPLPLTPAAQIGLGPSGKKIVEKTVLRALAAVRDLQKKNDVVVVEGVGGVLAPLGGPYVVADLMARLKLPVWVVARAGLGTLNHTLLTVEALKSRGVFTRRILLNGYKGKDLSEKSNGPLLRQLTGIPVTEIPYTSARLRKKKVQRLLWDAFTTDFPSFNETK